MTLLGSVRGQGTYTQPMYSIAWTSHTILVSVPDEPSAGKDAFNLAVQVWNQAQLWFLQSYEPNHLSSIYTLRVAELGEVPQVAVQYVSSNPRGDWAITYAAGTRIAIVLSKFGANPTALFLEPVSIHELGHVLGLGDNNVAGDIMRSEGPYPYSPSTLDLYAVYLQAVSGGSYGGEDIVTLPSQIPYTVWYPGAQPIPEFPAATGALMLGFVVPLLFLAFRTGDRRNHES